MRAHACDFSSKAIELVLVRALCLLPCCGRTRYRDEGNYIGQGRKNIVTYADLRGSYMLRHNIFLEARYLYRYQDSQLRVDTYSNQVASVALRWNLPYRNWVF